jgi:hypothetical protein
MANFLCNLMLYAQAGLHVEHGWNRPARARVALGGEPPRRHEQYAVLTIDPAPQHDQVHQLLQQVSEFLEQAFGVNVVSIFPSPLGLGLFQFENPIHREELLDASPINFAHGVISVHKHDEALANFRTCNYIRESWIMFLGFPLDYQVQTFVDVVVVAPFGRLNRWYEGPNKTRVIARCLLLSPYQVPRSLRVSPRTLLGGGGGRSWTVPTYILNGNFPDGFPQDEDSVPLDGVLHHVNAVINEANVDAPHGWQHELHGAAPHVHVDFGLNAADMEGVQQDLEGHIAPAHGHDGWDAWPADNAVQGDNLHEDATEPVVRTSLGPLLRWVLGPTTQWAPGTTRLGLQDTCWRGAQGLHRIST